MSAEKQPYVVVSTTIKLEQLQIGWVCTRPHYCQILRVVCVIWVESKLNLTHQYIAQHEETTDLM